MTVFAFTALAFVLFGVALCFAFLYVRAEVHRLIETQRRHEIRTRKLMKAEILQLQNAVAGLVVQDRIEKTTPPQPLNPFQKSEQRHLKELNTVVKVGEKPVAVG